MKIFFFQAEDGIRDQPRSRGLGDVYKRQVKELLHEVTDIIFANTGVDISSVELNLYTE